MDRRTLMTGMLGTAAAALWTAPDAFALGLPKDKIKRIRYYKTETGLAASISKLDGSRPFSYNWVRCKY